MAEEEDSLILAKGDAGSKALSLSNCSVGMLRPLIFIPPERKECYLTVPMASHSLSCIRQHPLVQCSES